MEAVSELTHYNFGEVYQMGVNEFFTYVAYCHYKAKKEEQKIREFRLKHNGRG